MKKELPVTMFSNPSRGCGSTRVPKPRITQQTNDYQIDQTPHICIYFGGIEVMGKHVAEMDGRWCTILFQVLS